MNFEPLAVDGAVRISQERHGDSRGHFARTWCAREFAQHGMPSALAQSSTSFSRRCGTIRGLHFQWPPSREDKLVRCTRGAIHDVLLDIRPQSPTYLCYAALDLDADSGVAVFIPNGVAHGFQTLVDDCEVLYYMTDFYAPDLADGLLWSDAAFQIAWPLPVSSISEADASWPMFDRRAYEARYATARSRA